MLRDSPMLLCARCGTWVLFAKVVSRRLHCVKRVELPGERRENETGATQARCVCAALSSFEPRKNASIVFSWNSKPMNFATAHGISIKKMHEISYFLG